MRRRCDGVPLYIDEVVAKLDAQPADVRRVGASSRHPVRSADSRAFGPAAKPCELSRGRPSSAATIDRRFAAARTVELSEHDLDAVIQRAHRRPGARSLVDAATWRFRHELLREVATETVAAVAAPSSAQPGGGCAGGLGVRPAPPTGGSWPVTTSALSVTTRPPSAYQRASREAQRRGAIEEARGYLTRGLRQVERLAIRSYPRPARGPTPACGAASCSRRPKGRRVSTPRPTSSACHAAAAKAS